MKLPIRYPKTHRMRIAGYDCYYIGKSLPFIRDIGDIRLSHDYVIDAVSKFIVDIVE